MGGELASDSCLVGTLSTGRDRKAVRVRYFFGRVLAYLTWVCQAHHPRACCCSTRLARMEITFRFATTSSHRKRYSSHHFGPSQDSGIGSSPSTGPAPSPLRPVASYRGALHSLLDYRFRRPPTGHYCHHRNYYSDLEGSMGDNRSGRFTRQCLVPMVSISHLVLHLRTSSASNLAIPSYHCEIQE